jgi:cytochrome c oxidase subunit 2
VARGSRLARLAALGLLGVVTLTGCEMPNNEFWRFGWPEGITEQSQDMRELWTGSVIAALIVGFAVWGLILYSVVRHRKRGDELPKQTAYNLPLEIVYTILPFLIIAALFFYTVVVQNRVMERSDDPDETIAVNAFKWNWQFVYPETSGPDGAPVDTVGSSSEIPILVLPTERSIRFEVASADVIHSFWVPEFLFKLDVIPGNENGRDNVFRRAVRDVPRLHELRGPGGVGRRLRRLHRGPRVGAGHVRGARGDRTARSLLVHNPVRGAAEQEHRPAAVRRWLICVPPRH